MAKCVGAVNHWTAERIDLEGSEKFLVEQVRQGEMAIKERVEELAQRLLSEIASDYTRIKQVALGDDDFLLDSRQLQDELVAKLRSLLNQTSSTIKCIAYSDRLIPSTRHSYFINFTYGLIEKLHQLCQTVGRLSEIDQKLYLEEQRKLLVSDESIAIHSLTSIWTAMLEILTDFCHQAKLVFNGPASGNRIEGQAADGDGDDDDDDMMQGDTYDFLEELEFSTARDSMAKLILMDLTICSWIKFNRLVKYEDLVKSIPFLCPCHMRIFCSILDGVAGDQILCDLLNSILDHEWKPSLMAISVRRPSVIPTEPCYLAASKLDRAYFLIWHLHALCARLTSATGRRMLTSCQKLMEKAFKLVRQLFLNGAERASIRRLSPHQEERYKLLFHMLNLWCEKQQPASGRHNVLLLGHLFEFAHQIDSLPNLETKYFNNSDFSVSEATLFQLCAKLMSDTVPMHNANQTQVGEPSEVAATKETLPLEQQQLITSWNILLDTHVHHRPQAAASKQ